MAVADVVRLGFGSSVNFVPTFGFTSGAAALPIDLFAAIQTKLTGTSALVSGFSHTSTNPRFHKDRDHRRGDTGEVYPYLVYSNVSARYESWNSKATFHEHRWVDFKVYSDDDWEADQMLELLVQTIAKNASDYSNQRGVCLRALPGSARQFILENPGPGKLATYVHLTTVQFTLARKLS